MILEVFGQHFLDSLDLVPFEKPDGFRECLDVFGLETFRFLFPFFFVALLFLLILAPFRIFLRFE